MKRILLKVSGEMLCGSGNSCIDAEQLRFMSTNIKSLYDKGIQIAVVIGAGNIIRGASNTFLKRNTADAAGMIGTAINSLVLQDILKEEFKIDSIVLGSFCVDGFIQKAMSSLIEKSLENKSIIIFSGGLGVPYFSTDTCAILRALEINADLVIKATKVSGVYDKDPIKFPDAKKLDKVSYLDVISKGLDIMDITAISLAMENKLSICVTSLEELIHFGDPSIKDIGTIIYDAH